MTREGAGPSALSRGGKYALPLVALWCFPLVAVLALELPVRQAESDALDGPAAETVVVGEREQNLRLSVRVSFVLSAEPRVLASGGGLVTAVDVNTGTEIANGDRLAEVGGIGVLADRGSRPYFRDLTLGSQGADVIQLNTLLSAVGVSSEEGGDRFTTTTARNVKELQRQLGARTDGVFRPAYTWFIPEDFRVVDSVLVQTGDVVAEGAATLVSQRGALSGEIAPEEPGGSLDGLDGGPLRLLVGSQALDIEALSVVGEAAESLRRAITAAGQTPQSDAESPDELYTGLALELREPPTFGAVPRSALFTSASGTLCLFTTAASVEPDAAQAVELSAEAGTGFEVTAALVPPELIGTHVFVAPTKLPTEVQARCT